MEGQRQTTTIIATWLQFLSWVNAILGIWYMILPSTDTPAMFIDKKYLIQQLIIDNFRRVPDKNEIGAGRIVNYSQTLVVSLYISAVSHRVERVRVTLLQHPSSLDSNEVQGFSAWSHEVDQRGHVWTWSDKISQVYFWSYIFNWRTKLENCHHQMRIVWVRDSNDKGTTWRKHNALMNTQRRRLTLLWRKRGHNNSANIWTFAIDRCATVNPYSWLIRGRWSCFMVIINEYPHQKKRRRKNSLI